MMHRPWDCAQPDEWLPQSLRLCWGSSGGGYGGDSGGPGMGDGGSGYGGGWGDGGFGGASTGGGDWGSAGSYDASSFNAASPDAYATALGDSPGGFFDTGGPGIAPGALGAEFGGGFGLSGTSGQPGNPAFGAELDAGGGGTSGLGNAIASWGLSTVAGGPGAGTGADLSGGFGGVGIGTGGGAYGGGGFGSGPFGGYGGGGGGYTGGGGGKGGGAFSGTSRGSVTDSTPGYVGSVSGGKDVTQNSPSDAPTTSEAQIASTEPAGGPEGQQTSEGDTSSAPSESQFGEPAGSEAAPQAEAGPSLSDAAPAGMIHGGSLVGQDNAPSETAPAETETSQSAFGPQSVNADYQGSPYADMGPSQGYQEAAQTLSDLTQSALSGGPDYQGSPYADMGQPATFDSRFGFDTAPQQDSFDSRFGFDTSAPTDEQVAPNFDQVFADLGIQPGWNPAEQLAGQTGLAEPTDWGANPYQPSTDVSVGRDFNQAFEAFDTPTGMDLAGDLATPQGDINPNSMFAMGWEPANAYEGRGADYASGRAAQDYVTSLVEGAPLGAAAPGLLSALSAMTGFSQLGLLGGTAATGGILGTLAADRGTTPLSPQQLQTIDVEVLPALSDQPTPLSVDPSTTGALQDAQPPAMPEAQPAPQVQPQEVQPQAPQETQPTQPQEAQSAPPSLIEQAQTLPAEVQPAAPPSLIEQATGLPPPALTPQVQPTETQPQQQPAPADEHDDAPEPQDTSQPPQDPNAPRPPANVPGQPIGSRGTYQNERADNPQTNQNYRDSGRTDYPQGRPGVTFRTARQAGIEPQFRIGDINVGDLDARLVDAINRAMADMPANIRGTLEASSGYRPAHRGEAIERGMDPRTSQESVYSRGHPSSGGGGFPSAQPGRSNHGHGRAIDFRSSLALTWLRSNAARYGLETIRGDHPHIQLRGAGGNVGPRPGEREQAEQRTLDAQNRQLAQDRGLLGGGRGNQLAGVPTPRARPTDAPQVEIARPQPPAEVPADIPATVNLPPVAPQETRPPADIPAPAPFLSPPARGRADPKWQTDRANAILKQATAHLNKDSGQGVFQAASVVAAKELAAAGIPLDMARSLMTKGALDGAIANGYGPGGPNSTVMGISIWGKVQSAIAEGIAAALQGYNPAATGPTPQGGRYGPGPVQGPQGFQPDAPMRGLAKGGHVAKDEPVVVGEEGPEYFVPDQPGTVFPHMPQPGKTGKSVNIDRWPKIPAPQFPGRYGGVEREMLRQTREAQNPSPGLMDMVDSGRLPLNDANWRAMLSDPALIALGRSRFEDRREGIDPGAEQYGTEQPGPVLPVGTYIPTPAPAADPNNPMAQALGYGSIKRRPMQIGRQSY